MSYHAAGPSVLQKAKGSAKITTAQRESLGLTLGCEFECLLAEWKSSDDEGIPLRYDPRVVIYKHLSKPIQGLCDICKTYVAFQLPLDDPTEEEDDWSKWQIVFEADVQPTTEDMNSIGRDRGSYNLQGLEIKTRILGHGKTLEVENEATHVHKIGYKEEIRSVLASLQKGFRVLDPERRTGFCLFTNSRCGFHVHIGREQNGFALRTVKNLITLSAIFERQIDGLHAKNRITCSTLEIEKASGITVAELLRAAVDPPVMIVPLSQYYIIGSDIHRKRINEFGDYKAFKARRGRKVVSNESGYPENRFDDPLVWTERRKAQIESWIELINAAPDLQSLQDLNYERRSCTINLQNLPTKKQPNKMGTIEFRQHAGTLEYSASWNFIEFLLALVKTCHYKTDAEIKTLVHSDSGLRQPEVSSADICEAIGCQPTVVEYYKEKTGMIAATRAREDAVVESSARAKQAAKDHDPLADLILDALISERDQNSPANVQGRIRKKLRYKAYGISDSHEDAAVAYSKKLTSRNAASRPSSPGIDVSGTSAQHPVDQRPKTLKPKKQPPVDQRIKTLQTEKQPPVNQSIKILHRPKADKGTSDQGRKGNQ
ncbi:hypothetical protein LTR37_012317 [Vermiconidia calcicola]|uniref:Uncharacterized protein n=1 Tax=Vermiconidia calcicola TaxID=1690605 RepID=A0ACC3MZN0_9PEZI|nr:hypothetical protein LTR37_012317 [Vermiconidia calcicola]